MPITVVGLGPGPYDLLTIRAARVLEAAEVVRLRTARHPTIDAFPPSIVWTSFDSLYEQMDDFQAVYATIVDELLGEARTGRDVVYAVPGDPSVGEASVALLRARAEAEQVAVTVVSGVSFLEPALQAIKPGETGNLQLVDALQPPDIDPTVPLVAFQTYSQSVASDLKLDLLRRYPPEHPAVVVRHAALADEGVREVALSELGRRGGFDHLTSVYVRPLEPQAATRSVQGLRAVIRRLRGPGGCPWDREQTHESIRQYVLEEAYEVAEAIDDGDARALKEELGDLLLQVVLHAQIADDSGAFDLDDVVQRLNEKLIGRHPHVFGDVTAKTAADVVRNWEALKRAEKGDTTLKSALDGIPRTMPALSAAQEMLRRADEAGQAWGPTDSEWARAEVTLRGLRSGQKPSPSTRELGELLLLVARRAVDLDVDAEGALIAASSHYAEAFRTAETARRGPPDSHAAAPGAN